MTKGNPLLQHSYTIPFDQIKAEHIEPAFIQTIQEAEQQLEDIVSHTGIRTFENTLLALDNAQEKVNRLNRIVENLDMLVSTPELHQAYQNARPRIDDFTSKIPLNEGLWKALQAYAATEEAQRLESPHKRFLKQTMYKFQNQGAKLDQAGKNRLAEIDVELGKLTMHYRSNSVRSTDSYLLVITEKEDLAGLPESAVALAKQNAEKKDIEGWLFTLHSPSCAPALQYLDNRKIRNQLYNALISIASQGEYDNREVIPKILALRKEKATLLGYKDFADFILADRMAKDGKTAQNFLHDLREKTATHFQRENLELEQFVKKLEGDRFELLPGDLAYYIEKLHNATFDFDQEELRPYFPLPQVMEGMFAIVNHLYGITVKETKDFPTWDGNVKTYKITDQDGTWLGSFYADLFPREAKKSGAWMDTLIYGGPSPEGFKPHLGLIVGNLQPSVGDKPALLTHDYVQTIFHEFGHLLHLCLGQAEIPAQKGPQVAWDFVELPSQIMENWCWEREALNLFAKHYQTGEKIPEELLAKLEKSAKFRGAYSMMRQLSFGTIDFALHLDYDPQLDGNVVDYSRALSQQFSPTQLPENYAFITNFNHLFGESVGYAAAYYSYKWAEALDADAFTRFKKEGILNRETGMSFRNEILAKGDSEDPDVLYRNFMGRDPDKKAILERAGLI